MPPDVKEKAIQDENVGLSNPSEAFIQDKKTKGLDS